MASNSGSQNKVPDATSKRPNVQKKAEPSDWTVGIDCGAEPK